MRIHCLQHVLFENPGTIMEWAAENGHTISFTYLFESPIKWPILHAVDALIILGGSMNTDEHEKYPWLIGEKILIREAIKTGKKVLGICLGAQLIAAALGSKVYPCTENEIGFFPIQFTQTALENDLFNHFTNPYTVFHWHGDTVDLPENAVLLASSAICKNQAYLIGNTILGLQFHFEMNEAVIESMMQFDGHELDSATSHIQSKEKIREGFTYLEQNKKDIFLLLNKFFV
jgi:GMP synthase-like glutamine amidotransferase